MMRRALAAVAVHLVLIGERLFATKIDPRVCRLSNELGDVDDRSAS